MQSHLYNAEILIAEMVIFHPTVPVTLPTPGTNFPTSIPIPSVENVPIAPTTALDPVLKPVDVPRLQILHTCLQNIKLSITTVLSFEPSEYVGFPFSLLGHISHSIQTLYRLSVLKEPDWDRAAVRREADIIAILLKLADKMGQVPAAAGLIADPATPYGDMFTKGAGTLKATAAIWGSALPAIGDVGETADASTAHFGQTVSMVTGMNEVLTDTTPLMIDPINDPWLTDLFTSWEWEGS